MKNLQDILVIETDWPAICNTTVTPLSEPTIPADVEGQITWNEDIAAVLNNVNLHNYCDKALGIVYWEPAWIGNAGLGSACDVGSFQFLEPAGFLTTFCI
ncbi:hypothetical protein J3R83DRAFT_12037 [Lanmaoa asiatica]|nr:hypothetical protein J3R83DRAFT_12037 [Lanmaoa asiatica]